VLSRAQVDRIRFAGGDQLSIQAKPRVAIARITQTTTAVVKLMSAIVFRLRCMGGGRGVREMTQESVVWHEMKAQECQNLANDLARGVAIVYQVKGVRTGGVICNCKGQICGQCMADKTIQRLV
jgi:hypothetical protein